MTVAREVGVTASRTTVERAFYEAGYGRYSPRSKPNLMLEMRQKRRCWCLDHAYWGFILGWDLVIYTDETSVKLGELLLRIMICEFLPKEKSSKCEFCPMLRLWPLPLVYAKSKCSAPSCAKITMLPHSGKEPGFLSREQNGTKIHII